LVHVSQEGSLTHS